MKKKSFFALTGAAIALAGIIAAGSVALVNHGGFAPFLTKATPKENGSYTLRASDFHDGDGDIAVGDGIAWHYNGATVSGNTVSLTGAFYTTARSGSTKNVSRRGNGYTSMTFADLDTSDVVGLAFHLYDIDWHMTKPGNPISAAATDLTFGGTVSASDRRGIEIVQGAGGNYSFSSLTLNYDCSDVSPEVEIQSEPLDLDAGENIAVQTKKRDVYDGDTVSYAWLSSDTDVATVSGDGANATVTGVAAGSATITVTMTVNGDDFTDTLAVTVSEIPATPVEIDLGEGSNIVGNQVFTYFDTESTGKTAAEITALPMTATLEGIENTIANNEIQSVAGNTFRMYSPMANGAVGLGNAFTLTYTFKDSANHYNYIGVAHYDNGTIAPNIVLSAASFSVEEGDTLEVTATKAAFLPEGTATFVFESLDTDVFTVAAVDNVATITGVAQGNATLRVTMTLNAKAYVVEKAISVTEPGVQHLITWYTEGTGNQTNHWDGAGVWTWVNYGALGYDGFGAFSAKKSEMTASYESDPATTIRVEVISDDIAASKVCRVYLVAGAAYNTGKLTMTIPGNDGITYTGTITFTAGQATAYNS